MREQLDNGNPRPRASRVNIAQLVFYAVASFFLGFIASAFNPPFGGEATQRFATALTIGAPLFFLVLAAYELARPSDRR